MAGRAALLCCGVSLTCAPREGPPHVDLVLKPGQLALVGSAPVTVDEVLGVAGAQALDPSEALEYVVRAQTLAQGFSAARPRAAESLRRAVLARQLEQQFMREAREAGDPSDAEVEEFTQQHWWELDRPRAVRTQHAVVLVSEGQSREAARRMGERLLQALLPVATPADFLERAENFDTTPFELRSEQLLPVTADGRVVGTGTPPGGDGGFGNYDRDYATAATALRGVGQVSPLVETSFGFHVIQLLEEVPEQRVSAERRKRILESEIMAARARQLEQALLERLRRARSIEVAPDVMALTGLLQDRQ